MRKIVSKIVVEFDKQHINNIYRCKHSRIWQLVSGWLFIVYPFVPLWLLDYVFMLEVKYSTTKKLLFISSQSQRRYGLIDDDIRTLLKYLMHNISIICYATLFHLVSVSNEKKIVSKFCVWHSLWRNNSNHAN